VKVQVAVPNLEDQNISVHQVVHRLHAKVGMTRSPQLRNRRNLTSQHKNLSKFNSNHQRKT
jgi:hypothetical protein